MLYLQVMVDCASHEELHTVYNIYIYTGYIVHYSLIRNYRRNQFCWFILLYDKYRNGIPHDLRVKDSEMQLLTSQYHAFNY